MKKSAWLPTFIASLSIAANAAFAGPNPFEPEATYTPENPRYITTEDPKIQAACPQLQEVQLEEVRFDRLPVGPATPSLYFPGNILSQDLLSPERAEAIDAFRFAALQAYPTEVFMININSPGGNIGLVNSFIYDLYNSQVTIITYANDQASSAAFTLLISGSNGWRYVADKTYLMTHEATNQTENGSFAWASNLSPADPNKALLEQTNTDTKNLMVNNSATEISLECAETLIQPMTDVQILPKDALKLGLVDWVIDWTDRTAVQRALAPQP